MSQKVTGIPSIPRKNGAIILTRCALYFTKLLSSPLGQTLTNCSKGPAPGFGIIRGILEPGVSCAQNISGIHQLTATVLVSMWLECHLTSPASFLATPTQTSAGRASGTQ